MLRVERYHVRVTVAGDTSAEVKLDLTFDQLKVQFLEPYERGHPITVNGRTIDTSDLERMKIGKSDVSGSELIARAKRSRRNSGVIVLGGPSYAWEAANLATDVTDELVKGPPGFVLHDTGSIASHDHRTSAIPVSARTSDGRSVFLVHGRDVAIADSFRAFLRALDLHIIEWEEAVRLAGNPNPYIGDTIEAGLDEADCVVVLATPDDIVRLSPELGESEEDPELIEARQPRQNVIFEAGMAMAVAPTKTLIVAAPRTKILSDIAGRHLARLDNSSQARKRIVGRLKNIGLAVDDSGTDWLTAGEFGDN